MRKIVAVILVLSFAFVPIGLLAQDNSSSSEYAQGRIDGERDAQGNAVWILAGVGCGCFGVIGAYLIKPEPPTSSIVGKSADYIIGYTEGYKKAAVGKNATYAVIGWGAFVLIYFAVVGAGS